jgi:hypothetical protein
MTASFSRRVFQAGAVLAFAMSMSVLSVQPSLAFSAEAQQMCTGDAFRFCSSDIPNIPAITACMFKHRTELSSGCCAIMDQRPRRQGQGGGEPMRMDCGAALPRHVAPFSAPRNSLRLLSAGPRNQSGGELA